MMYLYLTFHLILNKILLLLYVYIIKKHERPKQHTSKIGNGLEVKFTKYLGVDVDVGSLNRETVLILEWYFSITFSITAGQHISGLMMPPDIVYKITEFRMARYGK